MNHPPLFTCGDIAREIAKTRGACHRSTVWRHIARLQIKSVSRSRIALFTEADRRRIADALRAPNSKRA